MTAKDLAKKLAELGHVIAPETIRKDWGKGAPRTSAETYLRWREKHIRKGEAPDIKAARLELVQEQTALTRIRKEAEALELGKTRDELWPRAAVLAARSARMAKIRAQLDAKLLVDLPARLAGRPAEEIESGIGEALDAAYKEIAAS